VAYIPADAKWYLADIVIDHQIDGDPRHVVHVELILIRADSPEQAYAEAERIGRESELEYENTEGRVVRVVYRGLKGLNVIHDELEHGAELAYAEHVCEGDDAVRGLVTEKSRLNVFRPREVSAGPNYMPGSVADQLGEAGFDWRESEAGGGDTSSREGSGETEGV
jgi:hypothetical protein